MPGSRCGVKHHASHVTPTASLLYMHQNATALTHGALDGCSSALL